MISRSRSFLAVKAWHEQSCQSIMTYGLTLRHALTQQSQQYAPIATLLMISVTYCIHLYGVLKKSTLEKAFINEHDKS